MAEYTLSTGKKVITRELSAYSEFLMSGFLSVPMVDASNKFTAAYITQAGMLNAIFRTDSVNGKAIEVPTDQKSLIIAFSNFSSVELGEFMVKLESSDQSDDASGNVHTAPGSENVPTS
ncbi:MULTISPECIES: hypothetical protein [unclassified Paenibacillus]|uniref:hypothetical protein n=1 Tax=unclassified Paenibacillus TaxID=185978 RepID=UPI0036273479